MDSSFGIIRRASLAALVTSGLVACSGQPSEAPQAGTDPSVPQAVSIVTALEPQVPVAGDPGWALEDRMARYRAPGLSFAVFDDYEIVWAAAFGLTDAKSGTPVTTATLFQAGSISKSVAATAVMAAAERGEVDLDSPINTLLSSWQLPENEFTAVAPVTPRRLLSHSAGTTVHGFPGYAVDEAVPSLQQVLDGAAPANTAAVLVDTEPGTIFRYSGGGTTIMQMAMTDLAGIPYPDLLQQTVLGPIGMSSSTFEQPLPPGWIERAAAGHQRDGRPVWGNRHTYPEMAAAGLWTTPTDLARFAINMQRALRGDEDSLLERATVEEMVRPVLSQAGLGFFEMKSNDALYFGHNGADAGFQALLVASREGGHGAAIMVNSDSGIRLAMEILPAIARAFSWPGFAPEPRVPAPVDTEALEALVGLYEVRDHLILEVRRDADHLMGRVLLDSESTRLVPTEEGTFIAQDDGAELHFEPSVDGRAAGYLPANDSEAPLRPRLDESETPYVALFDLGRADEALARLTDADLSEDYLNQLGYTLLGYNRPGQAVGVFRLTAERYPGSANAHDSLGDGLLALGDTVAAAEAFQQVLAVLADDSRLPEEVKPQFERRARTQIRRAGVDPGMN